MGILKQNRKLIIHPDDFDIKHKPQKPDIEEIRKEVNEKLTNTNLNEDEVVSNYILNNGKKAKYRDGLDYIINEVKTIDDLDKFLDTVKGKRRVQVDQDRLSVKCPLCRLNGKHTNIMAFTQNISEIECCGVIYYK